MKNQIGVAQNLTNDRFRAINLNLLTSAGRVFSLWLIFWNLAMKESRLGHSCENCGQRIAFYTPEAAEELFGSLFQEATFLRLSALDFRNPNREVAEYWYCSDYCARDHIENRINDKEEQRRRELQANQLAFSFYSAA